MMLIYQMVIFLENQIHIRLATKLLLEKSKKIIIDYRPNDIIRIALTPLYTSFEDIYFFCYRLIEIVKEEEFKKKDNSMHGVT